MRVPFSFSYYLTGLLYAFKHMAPFEGFLGRIYQGIEGPPPVPWLTTPLWPILACFGLRPMLRNGAAVAAYIGHLVAAVLLFAAFAMTLRYSTDLFGLVALPAALGYRVLSLQLAEAATATRRRVGALLLVLALVGVVASHYEYMLSSLFSSFVPQQVHCDLHPFAPFIPYDVAGNEVPDCAQH